MRKINVTAVSQALALNRPDKNMEKAVDFLEKACERDDQIVLFPAMSLCGASLGDMENKDLLIRKSKEALESLAEKTANLDILYFVGLVIRKGDQTLPAQAVIYRGEVRALVYKQDRAQGENTPGLTIKVEPDKGICRETQILPAQELTLEYDGVKIGLSMEDPQDYLSAANIKSLHNKNIDILLMPLAQADRSGLRWDNIEKLNKLSFGGRAVILASAGEGESSGDFVYSGQCMISHDGKLVAEKDPETWSGYTGTCLEFDSNDKNPDLSDFKDMEEAEIAGKAENIEINQRPFIPEDDDGLEEILRIQSRGLMQRMKSIGAKDAWLGISGGLDSCLALLAIKRAYDLMGLGPERIHTVSMPSFGTGKRTRSNAKLLADKLGTDFREIDLERALVPHFMDIGLKEGDRSVAFENAQARERTQILFDLANLYGGIVVGTGDMSEIALGWATYNGDHMSSYAVNCNIVKSLCRELVTYEARKNPNLEDILMDIVDTPVSPELLPPKDGEISQETEAIIGPYDVHDFYLYYFMKYGLEPEKLLSMGMKAFPERTGRELLSYMRIFFRRFFTNQFKRSCSPDGPGIFEISLSPRTGLKMPSDADPAIYIGEVDRLMLKYRD